MDNSDKMQTNLGAGGGGNIYHSQTIFHKRNEHFKKDLVASNQCCA